MAVVTVTQLNWNDPFFWNSINFGSGGHVLDFTNLTSAYSVILDQMTGLLTISDGVDNFTVADATASGPSDATLGGTTQFNYFAMALPDGDNQVMGDEEQNFIDGGDGDDTIEGGTEDDVIQGGAGNDVLYGDAESPIGTTETHPVGNLSMSPGSVRAGSAQNGDPGNADDGTSVIYDNAATLDDGTNVAMRITLVDKSSDTLNVTLVNPAANQTIFLTGDTSERGETAEIRIEFINQDTGEPLVLSGSATFSDLDDNSGGTPGGAEQLILNAGYFSSYAVAGNTSLDVTQSNGMVTVEGTETNAPSDQDAWFQANFDGKSEINFTLVYGGVDAGFGFNGQDITNSVTTQIIAGDDVIDGGSGDDMIDGGGGNDTITGGEGHDTLVGAAGDDVITGGSGDDFIKGGSGNDQIYFGHGDTVLGGDGDDTFTVDADALTGGGVITITGGEGGETNGDTLDFNGLLEWDSLTFTNLDDNADGLSGFARLQDGTTVNFSEIETVVCFAGGTRISTPEGEVPVEQLAEGDLVHTVDAGPQPIRWLRATRHIWDDAPHSQKPVRIAAGSLGAGLPRHDLVVSPQHRVLLPDAEGGVLAPAKALTGLPGVRQLHGRRNVTYYHVFLPHHAILFSEGAPTESFYPGEEALRALSPEDRETLRRHVLRAGGDGYPPARPLMPATRARHLVAAGLAQWTSDTFARVTGQPEIRMLRLPRRRAG